MIAQEIYMEPYMLLFFTHLPSPPYLIKSTCHILPLIYLVILARTPCLFHG